MKRLQSWLREARRAKFWSPTGFVVRALLLLAVFLALHIAGVREYASFLSGTVPQTRLPRAAAEVMAVGYVFFYLCAIMAAPVLVLGAVFFHFLERKAGRGPESAISPPDESENPP